MATDMVEDAEAQVSEHDIDAGERASLDDTAPVVERRHDGAGARSSAGAGGGRRSGSRTSRRGAGLRRPVERTFAIVRADAATHGVLAAALDVDIVRGSDASLMELAVASLEDATIARSTLATLAELTVADDLEAGVLATGMTAERAAFKRLWAVLRSLDPSLPAGVPTRAVQAGLAAARSARGLADARRKTLERAYEVLA